jgi:hypothetical protein
MAYSSPAKVTSTGGLEFTATHSPAGVGRLEYIPFQLAAADPTGNAIGTPFAALPAAAGTVAVNMATPQISWAVCRIVGVVTTTTRQGAVTDLIDVQQLNVGGGPNLILSANGSRIELYDVANERFAGLRDYPILRSPNQCFLTIGTASGVGGANYAGNNLITAMLVVDVLADDNFGAHLPGPYARTNSLIRKPVGRR